MTGLHILLSATGPAEVNGWIVQNLQWLTPGAGSMGASVLSHEGTLSSVENLDDAVRTAAPVTFCGRSVDSLRDDLGRQSPGHDLICSVASTALRDDWRTHMERARSLGSLAGACGRWIARDAHGNLVDHNPGRIARSVTEWMFSPAMNGVVVRELPTEFVWIPHEMASTLLCCLDGAGNLHRALEAYFRLVNAEGTRKHVYLPDVFVYDCAS
jgi:hypothetical protein